MTTNGALFAEYCELLKNAGVCATELEHVSLHPDDCVIVVDMQHDFLPGGAFGVAEGDEMIPLICKLMTEAAEARASVFCTRDYHPANHCSFTTHGGPFPPHCIQGSTGSYFAPAIAERIQRFAKSIHVVFKGYSPDVDSFGSFQYPERYMEGRVCRNNRGKYCALNWTGAVGLFSSNFVNDPNAPPDVMAILSPVSLVDFIFSTTPARTAQCRTEEEDTSNGTPEAGFTEIRPSTQKSRLFICGLTLDFCVLDTAVTASHCPRIRDSFEIIIVLNACRAAYVGGGAGKFGSGFLSDPQIFVKTLHEHNIKLMMMP